MKATKLFQDLNIVTKLNLILLYVLIILIIAAAWFPGAALFIIIPLTISAICATYQYYKLVFN